MTHHSPRSASAPLLVSLVVSALAVVCIAPIAGAAPINLAPLGTASASSEGFGAAAADGNDGNRDGNYGNGSVFHTADPDTAAFYQVDLGGSHYIDRVQIFPRADARQGSVNNIRLSVFADDGSGNPGAAVFTRDYLAGTSTNFTFGTTDPAGVSGRFVRLDRLSTAPPFLTFSELEVIGQSTPLPANIALGKSATASDPGFGATIAGGNDGDIGGNFYQGGFPVYHSADSGVGQFFELDLGSMVPLDYLELIDRADADTTTQFRVAVLDETANEVFSEVVDSAGLLNYDHTLDLTDVTGRYLRIETTQAEFLAFSEIRAFAVPEPGAAALLILGAVPAVARRRR